jgi:hypothetical protein
VNLVEDMYHHDVRSSASSGLLSTTTTLTSKKMDTHSIIPDTSSSGVVGMHHLTSPTTATTPSTARTHIARPDSGANALPTNPSSLTSDTSSSGVVGMHHPASPKSTTTIMTPSTAHTHSARAASGENAPTNSSSLTVDVSSSGVVGMHRSPKSMTTLSAPCTRSAHPASEAEDHPINTSLEHVPATGDYLPKLTDVDTPLQAKPRGHVSPRATEYTVTPLFASDDLVTQASIHDHDPPPVHPSDRRLSYSPDIGKTDDSDHRSELMDMDPPLQTNKDVTSLLSIPTQSLKQPSFVQVTPSDSYMSPTTVTTSLSSPNNMAAIKFPQSNTSAVPSEWVISDR